MPRKFPTFCTLKPFGLAISLWFPGDVSKGPTGLHHLPRYYSDPHGDIVLVPTGLCDGDPLVGSVDFSLEALKISEIAMLFK